MLIHDKFYGEGYYNYLKFRNILEKLSERRRVEFALYCAKDVYHLVNDEYKEVAKTCIDLVEKWLVDESSVINEELRIAVYIASNAANNASNAVWSAAYAAVWSTAYAAAYVADADVAAADASWSAARACGSGFNKKINEYLVIANSYLTKTTINCPNYEIEGKILYLIDELEENIIVHKDKYYVNMNEIELCPEYGFNTQQELLDKLLYSEDRFWVFTRNWLDNLYKEESNVDS